MLSANGVNQGELVEFLKALRNRRLSKSLLATASTVARIKTTNVTEFEINGVVYTKAATDNISMSDIAASGATGASQTRRIRVEIDSAGTVTFKPGPLVTGAQGTGFAPLRTASRCTLGILDFPASFTPNTTTTVGVTFTDGDPDLGVQDLYDSGAGTPSLEA